MNYAVILLERGLVDVQKTRDYLFACNWTRQPNWELIKVDYQIETIKNEIDFIKNRNRKTESEIIKIIANEHRVDQNKVREVVNEKPKYGRGND